MTLGQLSKATNISVPALGRLERGDRDYRPADSVLQSIRKALGADFLGHSESSFEERLSLESREIAENLPPKFAEHFAGQLRCAGDLLRRRLFRGDLAHSLYLAAKAMVETTGQHSQVASLEYLCGRSAYDLGTGRSRPQTGGSTADPRHLVEALRSFQNAWPTLREESNHALGSLQDRYFGSASDMRAVHEYQAVMAYSARALIRLTDMSHMVDAQTWQQVLGLVPDLIETSGLRERLAVGTSWTDILCRFSNLLFASATGVLERAIYCCNDDGWAGPRLRELRVWSATYRSERVRTARDIAYYGSEARLYDTEAIAADFVAEAQMIREWCSADPENHDLRKVLVYLHREIGHTWCAGSKPSVRNGVWHFYIAKELCDANDKAERDFIDDLMPNLDATDDNMASGLISLAVRGVQGLDYPMDAPPLPDALGA